MSVLIQAARKLSLLFAVAAVLGSVACSGAGQDQPAYASTDIKAGDRETGQPIQCETGSVQECTIWLGQHGDLGNCVHGLDICADGTWTGCLDDATLSSNPDLYGQIVKQ
jgi:hypothetical protein